MDIQLDDNTQARINAAAAHQNIAPDVLAAAWLRSLSKQFEYADQEQIEDLQRLDNMKRNGGTSHTEMMDWLDDFAAGKDV